MLPSISRAKGKPPKTPLQAAAELPSDVYYHYGTDILNGTASEVDVPPTSKLDTFRSTVKTIAAFPFRKTSQATSTGASPITEATSRSEWDKPSGSGFTRYWFTRIFNRSDKSDWKSGCDLRLREDRRFIEEKQECGRSWWDSPTAIASRRGSCSAMQSANIVDIENQDSVLNKNSHSRSNCRSGNPALELSIEQVQAATLAFRADPTTGYSTPAATPKVEMSTMVLLEKVTGPAKLTERHVRFRGDDDQQGRRVPAMTMTVLETRNKPVEEDNWVARWLASYSTNGNDAATKFVSSQIPQENTDCSDNDDSWVARSLQSYSKRDGTSATDVPGSR